MRRLPGCALPASRNRAVRPHACRGPPVDDATPLGHGRPDRDRGRQGRTPVSSPTCAAVRVSSCSRGAGACPGAGRAGARSPMKRPDRSARPAPRDSAFTDTPARVRPAGRSRRSLCCQGVRRSRRCRAVSFDKHAHAPRSRGAGTAVLSRSPQGRTDRAAPPCKRTTPGTLPPLRSADVASARLAVALLTAAAGPSCRGAPPSRSCRTRTGVRPGCCPHRRRGPGRLPVREPLPHEARERRGAPTRESGRGTKITGQNVSADQPCGGAGGTRTHGRRIMSPLL